MPRKEPLDILREPTPEEQKTFEKTVVIIITTIPTIGPDGTEGIGGAGASSLAKLFAHILGDKAHLVQTGDKMREISAHIIQQKGETEFVLWRGRLLAEGNYDFDQQVDAEAIQDVVVGLDSFAVTIFDTKIGDQLNRRNQKFAAFVLGVDVPHAVAVQRTRQRKIDKGDIEDSNDWIIVMTQRDDIAVEREIRYQNDQKLYQAAYGLEYSRAAKLDSIHSVLDNGEELSPPEQSELAWAILWQIAKYAPALNRTLIDLAAKPQ